MARPIFSDVVYYTGEEGIPVLGNPMLGDLVYVDFVKANQQYIAQVFGIPPHILGIGDNPMETYQIKHHPAISVGEGTSIPSEVKNGCWKYDEPRDVRCPFCWYPECKYDAVDTGKHWRQIVPAVCPRCKSFQKKDDANTKAEWVAGSAYEKVHITQTHHRHVVLHLLKQTKGARINLLFGTPGAGKTTCLFALAGAILHNKALVSSGGMQFNRVVYATHGLQRDAIQLLMEEYKLDQPGIDFTWRDAHNFSGMNWDGCDAGTLLIMDRHDSPGTFKSVVGNDLCWSSDTTSALMRPVGKILISHSMTDYNWLQSNADEFAQCLKGLSPETYATMMCKPEECGGVLPGE